MYTYIMNRTQIYLTPALDDVLARLSQATGRSRSQLIREALERAYLGAADSEGILTALATSHGAWRGRERGDAYVEALRPGRLGRLLGLDPTSARGRG